MREDTVTTKVYPFDELSNEAKQVAIEKLYALNVDYGWWEFVYMDATQIGLVIEEHCLDRGAYCRGKWTEDGPNIARLILEHHGETCETHKDATVFVAEYDRLEEQHSNSGMIENIDFIDSIEYIKLWEKFQQTICEDYRIMLQKEYEYLTSEESIIETIEANEYEFTANGKLY